MYGGKEYAGNGGFVARFLLDAKHHCTGAAVRAYWVVTAAHCVQSPKARYAVLLGSHNLKESQNDVNVQQFRVQTVVQHPRFAKKPFYQNDIALVRLRAHLPWTQAVLALDSEETEYDLSRLVVVGWGDATNPALEGVLTRARAPRASAFQCSRTYFGRFDARNELCAGSPLFVEGPCFADSGAPLVAQAGHALVLVGVVSRGKACHKRHPPNIFSSVQAHLPWLESVFYVHSH